jgi:hypothetical protein
MKSLGPEQGYEYQPQLAKLSFAEAVDHIRGTGRKVVPYGVDSYSPGMVEALQQGLLAQGLRLTEYPIDVARFEAYRASAEYAKRYPAYYGTSILEKQLEHFVTLDLLNLRPGDVFIDLASENSPIPEIYERLSGASTYWQDIQYAPGIKGRQIGGDACDMPVASGFATAAALTCSLEHFERDADMRLCTELARVIRSGGRFVIAPLYMHTEHVVQTDPVYSAQVDVPFDAGATIFCQENWGNRHGRFYSPATLRERIISRLEPHFDVEIVCIRNHEALQEFTYLRFVLLCRRR